MLRKSKWLFGILLLLVLLAGCVSSPYVAPPECDGSVDSVILNYMDDPRRLSSGLVAVQLAALDSIDNYGAAEATKELDRFEVLLDSDITFATFVKLVSERINLTNREVGLAVFLLGDYVPVFGTYEIPISDCDKALIRRHIDKQRALLVIYNSE